jgi:hypothetical protein
MAAAMKHAVEAGPVGISGGTNAEEALCVGFESGGGSGALKLIFRRPTREKFDSPSHFTSRSVTYETEASSGLFAYRKALLLAKNNAAVSSSSLTPMPMKVEIVANIEAVKNAAFGGRQFKVLFVS